MTSQLRVKSGPTFPYTYIGGDGLIKRSPQPGTELLDFEQFVDPNGNTWVTGSLSISGVASGITIPISVLPGTTIPVTVSGLLTDNITQIGGTAITLGQKIMAQSIPVVLASNQSSLPLALPNIAQGNVPLNSTSVAYETSRIAKTAPGVMYGMSGFNSKNSAQFISLFDSSLLPANGAIPVLFVYIAAVSSFSFDFGSTGRQFNAGIVAANSSTGPTLTLGSTDTWFDVQYS